MCVRARQGLHALPAAVVELLDPWTPGRRRRRPWWACPAARPLARATFSPASGPGFSPQPSRNARFSTLFPLPQDLFADGAAFAAAAAAGLNSADESLPYSTSELNAPEYSTDDFRMFQFKVARCSKRYVHDWRACPFAHPTENARRRDPRMVKYLPVPCPDYKRGICLRFAG